MASSETEFCFWFRSETDGNWRIRARGSRSRCERARDARLKKMRAGGIGGDMAILAEGKNPSKFFSDKMADIGRPNNL